MDILIEGIDLGYNLIERAVFYEFPFLAVFVGVRSFNDILCSGLILETIETFGEWDDEKTETKPEWLTQIYEHIADRYENYKMVSFMRNSQTRFSLLEDDEEQDSKDNFEEE